MSRLICLCNGIREDQITKVLATTSTPDLKLVQESTGAATNCGRCISSIESIIDKTSTNETIGNK